MNLQSTLNSFRTHRRVAATAQVIFMAPGWEKEVALLALAAVDSLDEITDELTGVASFDDLVDFCASADRAISVKVTADNESLNARLCAHKAVRLADAFDVAMLTRGLTLRAKRTL